MFTIILYSTFWGLIDLLKQEKKVWLTVAGARLDPLSLILVFPMLDSNTTGFLATVSKFVEGFTTSGVLLKVGDVAVLTGVGRLIGAAKAWLDKI